MRLEGKERGPWEEIRNGCAFCYNLRETPSPDRSDSAMVPFTREQLSAYLDDALSAGETSQVEQALRQSDALRTQLRGLMLERDRGEHSIGAIWRRRRLTCASREQLGNYLLQILDGDQQDYIRFHLETIGCAYCLANLADLQAQQREPATRSQQRRRRFFESSAGLLRAGRVR
jgi:hypothetical protein